MSTPVERVQEYLRQRKELPHNTGIGIHSVWADSRMSRPATLTVPDVEALLAAATTQPKDTREQP